MFNRRLSLFCFLVFAILLAYLKFGHHELWKDEWQAWFDARDMGFGEMLSFLHYEGHPFLWYVYLKLFVPFRNLIDNQDEHLIQLAHWLIVSASFLIFFTRIRLPLLVKVLFAAGYFLGFEYGLINRSYALVILISFLCVDRIQQEKTEGRLFPLLLFLLCQTEVYGVFIAAVLLFYLCYPSFPAFAKVYASHKTKIHAYLLGLFVFVITVFPRGNEDDFQRAYLQSWFGIDSILNSFQGLLSNTFLIGITPDTASNGWSGLGLIASLIVLVSLVFIFRNSKKILWCFILLFLAFLLFGSLIYTGGVRQWGMFFVGTLCLLSLLNISWDKKNLIPILLLTVFGIFQMIHGFHGFQSDFNKPFTNAKEAGEFLKEKVPENVPIIGINKFEITPVVGYADRKFYELPSGEPFSYFKWLEKVYLPSVDEMKLFGQFKGVGGVIVISPRKLEGTQYNSLQLWQSFDQPNFKQERYYVYTLKV